MDVCKVNPQGNMWELVAISIRFRETPKSRRWGQAESFEKYHGKAVCLDGSLALEH